MDLALELPLTLANALGKWQGWQQGCRGLKKEWEVVSGPK